MTKPKGPKAKPGDWAKDYRRRNGLTQQQLADKLELSKSLICRFESGERVPDIELVPVIKAKLGIMPRLVRPDLASILR
jgi:transcriptional regulator with XRE-family HTH domain